MSGAHAGPLAGEIPVGGMDGDIWIMGPGAVERHCDVYRAA